MINIENINKSFGDRILFENVSFKVNPKERIGLVGRNGHGKTTFFRMIIGEDHYDAGAITMPKGYRIGYVQQEIEFTKDTVLKEGMTGLPASEKDHYWKVEKILSGLGFNADDMDRHPHEFSGGYQVRLNLAKVLVSEPDLLLLDEPTNYLDITSIRWIENYLLNWPHELLLITHDRSLMDKLVTHIVGIHRKKMRKIAGNTEKYYSWVAQDEEVYEKTRFNDEKRRKEIDLFISRFRAKARLASMVQSRIKTLEKMEKRDKLETIKDLEFSFRSKPFPGRQVMSAEKIKFAYKSSEPIIDNFNMSIGPRERICVIGQNGKGKTTLLKILAGVLQPQEGKVTYNPSTVKGFFEQTNISSLVDGRTIEEEILYSYNDVDRQKARNICGAMMFEGDDALKKISVLSGGEKSRVMLGKLLVTPANLLLLDEPTNHLDMDSCDALLAAIDSFEGVVIIVTHNEMFLHAIAEKLIVFQNEKISLFNGTYQYFLEKEGWALETAGGNNQNKQRESETGSEITVKNMKLAKKELKRRRSELNAERGKIIKPIKNEIKKIESTIEALEKKTGKLNEELVAASGSKDGIKIAELSKTIHSCGASIDELYDKLEVLTLKFEEHNAVFERQILELTQD